MIHPVHDIPQRFELADEAATLALGARLARALTPGLVIFLAGDLGAGKTTFARGVLRGLGYEGRVKSPTYTLVELYAISNLDLYHFDFYRFESPDEYLEAGLDEYFSRSAVCMVEWAEKAGAHAPAADLSIALRVLGNGREAIVTPHTDKGRVCLGRMMR